MNPNLPSLTKEKRESPMKRLLMPGTALAAVLVLLVFVPKAMCSHTGGAQLRITGTVGSQSINVAINDGDLHSATFESRISHA